MIARVTSNKKPHPVVIVLFIRDQKLNISFAFITQSYFPLPNITQTFMKIPNRRELQQIAVNHSSDSDFDEFKRFLRKYTADLFSLLVSETTLPSKIPLCL